MQREGIFREMKLRNYYEKPSEKRAREGRSHPPRPQARPQEGSARRTCLGQAAHAPRPGALVQDQFQLAVMAGLVLAISNSAL
jgi:hypothetical protein